MASPEPAHPQPWTSNTPAHSSWDTRTFILGKDPCRELLTRYFWAPHWSCAVSQKRLNPDNAEMCVSLTSPLLSVSDHFPFLTSFCSESHPRWARGYLRNPPLGNSPLAQHTPCLTSLVPTASSVLLSKWPSLLSSWICGPSLCCAAICPTPFCGFYHT